MERRGVDIFSCASSYPTLFHLCEPVNPLFKSFGKGAPVSGNKQQRSHTHTRTETQLT